MALQRSRTRPVYIHQALDSVDNDIASFNASYSTLRVAIQPLDDQLSAQVYGERMEDMRLLLTNKPTTLLPKGTGVCVDVAADALPDYRVVSSKPWFTHTRVILKWYAEGNRGQYGA